MSLLRPGYRLVAPSPGRAAAHKVAARDRSLTASSLRHPRFTVSV
ncbi:hypothetical protein BH20ACT21_BH20ACT21_13290 [soil metagenome]